MENKIDSRLLMMADVFAEEIREGKWDSIYNSKLSISANVLIIDEFEKCCPGFRRIEYVEAIARGMQNTR